MKRIIAILAGICLSSLLLSSCYDLPGSEDYIRPGGNQGQIYAVLTIQYTADETLPSMADISFEVNGNTELSVNALKGRKEIKFSELPTEGTLSLKATINPGYKFGDKKEDYGFGPVATLASVTPGGYKALETFDLGRSVTMGGIAADKAEESIKKLIQELNKDYKFSVNAAGSIKIEPAERQ